MLPYPETMKVDTVDNYFGTNVPDPYRWLEDDNSQQTADWVAAQNKVTQDYLSQIPQREKIRNYLTETWNYARTSAPARRGEYYYFSKNDGLQNQSVIYRQKGLDGEPEIFLDPNALSEDGTVALTGTYFSNDNKYLAYSIARSGSDWTEFFLMDVETKELLEDHLLWTKFSTAAWFKDGFYYSRYDEPKDEASKLSAQNQFHKVYYHKIGTPQSADKLIYEDKLHPLRYVDATVSENEEVLVLTTTEGTSGNELYFQDLRKPNSPIIQLVQGFEHNYSLVDFRNDKLYILTDRDAPKYRLAALDVAALDTAKWTDIVPEKEHLLESASCGGGKIFLSYLQDASTHVFQADYDGTINHEIELPAIGTAGGFEANFDDTFFFYTFTSYTIPATAYKYDIQTGKSELYLKSEIKFNSDDFEVNQVFYPSKDGTKIPLFLVHKKGLKLDGQNPVYLYAYGGFNFSLTPAFTVARLPFIEKGGILAIANIRGGGEYGEEWHKAGMLANKQNVFDDFIAAAEYLINEKYTCSEKIAIAGGSNGGLLVGAVMTQRPELFKVALPAVGVLDMLRYHKFTVGWGWAVEYGSSDKPEEFDYIYKYSPLHNVKAGTRYPATLITTADHDDRVVPAHSFKFAATLQELASPESPILIRIDAKAGHGAGKPLSKTIDELADTWAFTFHHLGMNF